MANIIIRITDFSRDAIDPGKFNLNGVVIADEGAGAPIEWMITGLLMKANEHVINQAILDAAITALWNAEALTVNDTSRVRIFGAAS